MPQEPSRKQFLSLAVPNMLAGLAVPITHLVDLAYLGHLEDVTPLSGVVLATVIFDYIFWCFIFLRMGTTGLVAQAAGRNDRDEQAALFWRPMLLGLVIGVIITLLRHPIGDIAFLFLTGSEAVEAAGRDYFNSNILGAIPVMGGLAIVGWLLGQGRSTMVWILHLIWQSSNIILNYVFIVEFGWGAWGAGLGTAISEWISLIAGLIAIALCWRGVPQFNWQKIIHWQGIKPLIHLNMAIMLRTFTLMTVLAAFTNIAATIDEVALAANALLMKLLVFFAFTVDGFAVALETLAGTYTGQNNGQRLRRAFRMAMNWNIAATALCLILYIFAMPMILSLLTEHESVIQAALEHTQWLLWCVFWGGIAFILDGLFLGVAKPRALFLSMFCAALCFIIPAYYAWQTSSIEWLWIAFSLFTALRVSFLIYPSYRQLHPAAVTVKTV